MNQQDSLDVIQASFVCIEAFGQRSQKRTARVTTTLHLYLILSQPSL